MLVLFLPKKRDRDTKSKSPSVELSSCRSCVIIYTMKLISARQCPFQETLKST